MGSWKEEGNWAISISPTLSNMNACGSERLSDVPKIMKPVSSGAGKAGFTLSRQGLGSPLRVIFWEE